MRMISDSKRDGSLDVVRSRLLIENQLILETWSPSCFVFGELAEIPAQQVSAKRWKTAGLTLAEAQFPSRRLPLQPSVECSLAPAMRNAAAQKRATG